MFYFVFLFGKWCVWGWGVCGFGMCVVVLSLKSVFILIVGVFGRGGLVLLVFWCVICVFREMYVIIGFVGLVCCVLCLLWGMDFIFVLDGVFVVMVVLNLFGFVVVVCFGELGVDVVMVLFLVGDFMVIMSFSLYVELYVG